MANKLNISEGFSFKGWQFKKWITGNWKTIKELLKVGLPFFVSTFFTDIATQQFLITVVGKFVMDVGEFYFSKVNLD